MDTKTYKEIPLTGKGNHVAIVDVDRYEELSRYTWRAQFANNPNNPWQVVRTAIKEDGATRKHHWTIFMSRQIMNAPKGIQVDHVNHNIFDNRVCNLRLATQSQNQMNRLPNKNNKCKYKGVIQYKRDTKFRVIITANGKIRKLGSFDTAIEAAKVYDMAAKKYHGNFAYLNFG